MLGRSERGTDNTSTLTANSGLLLTISHLISWLKNQKTNRGQAVRAPGVGSGRTMDISDHQGPGEPFQRLLRPPPRFLFRYFQSCCYWSLRNASL